MPDQKTRFIQTAVRPLHDNAEMEMAASKMLEEMMPASGAGLDQAIARWNTANSGRRKGALGLVFRALLIALTALVVARDSHEVARYVEWREWLGSSMGSKMPSPDESIMQGLTSAQLLLISGDPFDVNRKEALWRTEPENPAFFSDYAAAFSKDRHALPPDYFDIARRIDPDNAWFTYLAASEQARGTVEQGSQPSGTDEWKVLDQPRLDQALALLEKARSQPKFENYSTEMLRRRIALLPTRNLIERMDAVAVLSNQSSNSIFRMIDVQSVVLEQAWRAGKNGDVEAFHEIVKTGEHFLDGLLQKETATMLEEVITTGNTSSMASQFAKTAEQLGLDKEAVRWKGIVDRIAANRKSGRARTFAIEGRSEDPELITGSLFGSHLEIGVKVLGQPPRLTDADLKPGRLLDHEILSRFCSYALWIAMGVCLAAVAAYRFRVSRLARRLAKRISELLDCWDQVWVLGVGVVLPLVYVVAVSRLTPLGGRQFGMIGTGMLLPTAQFLGLLALWLTVPVQITRWRLAKQAGALGFRNGSWMGWVAIACAVGSIPLIGWAAINQSFAAFWRHWMEELGFDLSLRGTANGLWQFWTAVGLLGASLLWVLICVSRTVLGRRYQLVHHAITARLLVRTYEFAMLLLLIATMTFKASESYWFEREALWKLDPAKPGWSAFEHDVAAQIRIELLEILDEGS